MTEKTDFDKLLEHIDREHRSWQITVIIAVGAICASILWRNKGTRN
jgi:hypothetical protein